MIPDSLSKILLKKPGHRKYKSLSENIVLDAKRILEFYDGDCRNIWEDQQYIGEVILKFREFRGIGQKIACARILFFIISIFDDCSSNCVKILKRRILVDCTTGSQHKATIFTCIVNGFLYLLFYLLSRSCF